MRLGRHFVLFGSRLASSRCGGCAWPVVSIGNLSTGGAGKTPLTIALAKLLTARGFQVDVLSRGYGRRSALSLAVNPNGTTEDFGDEPLLIARAAGVPVFVGAQRYEAGLLAEASANSNQNDTRPQVHILDDGFQHRQLPAMWTFCW